MSYSSMIMPARYIQGKGVFKEAGKLIKPLGTKALFLRDKVVAGIVGPLEKSCAEEGVTLVPVDFGGEVSKKEIDRISALAREAKAGVVMGVGGGKVIDVAKSVGHGIGAEVVIVPTIAATDAPTSAVAVIYTEAGTVEEYRLFDKNPSLVLVDTEVVAHAPARFLVSGMGDALATWFEARASAEAYQPAMSGGMPTMTALNLAKLCYETLLEYGLAAKLAVEKQAVTPAVEKIVEANILLSGLGFESGGLAAAHAIHNGLTVLEATHNLYHGEKVAFGTVSQLMLETRPMSEIERVFDFCISLGLPATLEDLHLGKVSREDLLKVAETACATGETIHNEPFEVRPEMVVDAMLAADAFGKARKERR